MASTETLKDDSLPVDGSTRGRVKLKKTLNIFSIMSMIVGTIIGSGIFISPKGVLLYTGSVGLNLVVWALCGLIAIGGSLCYMELGTVVQESGGEWAYIKEGMGGAPAFLAAWMNTVLIAASAAAICLSSSQYLLSPFFGCGDIPVVVTKLTGLAMIWLVIYINTSVKLATKVLKLLFLMKVLALGLIVVGGLYWLIEHGVEKLENSFEETTDDGWKIALGFYSGLWAYDGWNTANFVTEEVKNVKKTMPRAIIGSLVLVISLYLLVNVSYYAVLTRQQVIDSNAVASDWAAVIVGRWSVVLDIIVSLSMFGSAIASFFGSSRVLMATAREGHTIELLSMVNVKDNSPLMSLYCRGFLSMIICLIGDISELIDFFSFCAWLFYGMSFISLIILRVRRRRNNNVSNDVFEVPIILPIIMTLVSIYLVVVPIIADPKLPFLYAGIFMVSGLILYFPFVLRKMRVKRFDRVTLFFQLLCKLGLPDKEV